MIHAQTVREDQLTRMKTRGMIPSYFSAHTFYWGDWHRDSVLGEERARRISRSGRILGAAQRISIHEALRAMTIYAAYQNFEEADKGTIEAGKLADLVVLSRDPLAMEPADLLDLEVTATWSRSAQIYTATRQQSFGE